MEHLHRRVAPFDAPPYNARDSNASPRSTWSRVREEEGGGRKGSVTDSRPELEEEVAAAASNSATQRRSRLEAAAAWSARGDGGDWLDLSAAATAAASAEEGRAR